MKYHLEYIRSYQNNAKYLFESFLGHYLQVGVCEIHVIFDSPGNFKFHPRSLKETEEIVRTSKNMSISNFLTV